MKQRRRSTSLSDEQYNFLERKLASRTEVQPRVASSISGPMRELEKSMVKDNLTQLMSMRPERDELGDLLPSAGVADGIAGARRKLERSMTEDKISKGLAARPRMADLAAMGMMEDGSRVAPALQQQQNLLKKNLVKSNLYHALYARPSLVELMNSGKYVPQDDADYEAIRAAAEEMQDDEEDDEDYTYGEPIGVPYDEEDEGDDPAYVDEEGNPHYHDADGNLYVVYEDGNAYYVDDPDQQEIEPYYIDKEGNPYYLDENQRPYIVAEDGQAYYVEADDPEGQDEEYGNGDGEGDEYEADGAYDNDANEYDNYAEDDQTDQGAMPNTSIAQDRSRAFMLTRLLLKTVSNMSRAGELSDEHKGMIKDLIVDQDEVIWGVAESYLEDEDLGELKESLLGLVM